MRALFRGNGIPFPSASVEAILADLVNVVCEGSRNPDGPPPWIPTPTTRQELVEMGWTPPDVMLKIRHEALCAGGALRVADRLEVEMRLGEILKLVSDK